MKIKRTKQPENKPIRFSSLAYKITGEVSRYHCVFCLEVKTVIKKNKDL